MVFSLRLQDLAIFFGKMKWARNCLVLALLGVATATLNGCPKKCKCLKEELDQITAYCSHLIAGQQTFSPSIEHLSIVTAESEIALGADILQKSFLKGVKSIEIMNSSINILDETAFRGLHELFDLNLADNGLTAVPSDVFVDNPKLVMLNFSGNPLRVPNRKYLINSTSLLELDLSRCELDYLAPETFGKVPHLMALNLSTNRLSQIPANTFTTVKYVDRLDLSNNLIHELNDAINSNIFRSLQHLSKLNLGGNKLTYIPSNMFDGNPHLYSLSLSGNPLSDRLPPTQKYLIKSESLENLYLSQCNLKNLPAEVFSEMPNLKFLDISYNQIEILADEVFAKNSKLINLNLRGNAFVVLPVATFKLLPNLKDLDVSNCKLKYIWNKSLSRYRSMQLLPALSYLNISQNKLQCIQIHDFRFLKNLRILEFGKNPVNCSGPLNQLLEYLFRKCISPTRYTPESFELLSAAFRDHMPNEKIVKKDDVYSSFFCIFQYFYAFHLLNEKETVHKNFTEFLLTKA